MSVTGLYGPNAPQLPSARVASARSTTPLPASTPAPESEPSSSVSGTESDANQGPLPSATDWPAGAVVSGSSVNVSVETRPAAFVATTGCAPVAPVDAVQS